MLRNNIQGFHFKKDGETRLFERPGFLDSFRVSNQSKTFLSPTALDSVRRLGSLKQDS